MLRYAVLLTTVVCCSDTLAAKPDASLRTPDGRPDLQGIWISSTLTPLERPAEFGDKEFLSETEAAALEAKAHDQFFNPVRKDGDVGRDNEAFQDQTILRVAGTRQTSLVVLPRDGRIPMRPEALRLARFNTTNFDAIETLSPWDRCITRGPATILPVNYNNAFQIVQTRDTILLVGEMIHEARVVHMSGQHPDGRIQSWVGDSRGHWDGDTLVVDTTNFHNKGWFITNGNAGRIRGTPHTEQLHLIERFARIDANTIRYEMTVDDPAMYSSPWTARVPLVRDNDYQIFEYACHEGNSAIEAMMLGARAYEARTQR